LGYTLEAVIGAAGALYVAVRRQPAAVLIPLRHDIGLVPMTDELFDAVTDGTAEQPLPFWKLPAGFDRELASWSSAGPVGYVEAELGLPRVQLTRGVEWFRPAVACLLSVSNSIGVSRPRRR
jgi:hypothetical protein